MYCVYFVVIAVDGENVENSQRVDCNFLYIDITDCYELINFAHTSISSLIY